MWIPEYSNIQFYLPGFSPDELRHGPIANEGFYQKGKTSVEWVQYEDGKGELIFDSMKHPQTLYRRTRCGYGQKLDVDQYVDRFITATPKERRGILKELAEIINLVEGDMSAC